MADKPAKNLTGDERQALLTEYQVTQQAVNSSAQNYWTLAGIFIGISSVLLGGLIYAYLSNNSLSTTRLPEFKVITLVVGIAVIIIIITLWWWLGRVNYLADLSYSRMREIELKLVMWKNWRIEAIDQWNKMGFKHCKDLDDKKINEIWERLSEELKKKSLYRDIIKLESRKAEII